MLDFADFGSKLAVELDGDTHAVGDGPARDAARTTFLEEQGWQVIRFTNREVFANLEGVLTAIAIALRGRPHPDPLPKGEGEVLPAPSPFGRRPG